MYKNIYRIYNIYALENILNIYCQYIADNIAIYMFNRFQTTFLSSDKQFKPVIEVDITGHPNSSNQLLKLILQGIPTIQTSY